MKTLCMLISALGLAVMFTGCDIPEDAKIQLVDESKAKLEPIDTRPKTGGEDFLSGSVVKIFGNVPGLESSSIAVRGKGVYGGGETIRLGEQIYGIQVQTSNGLYTIQFKGNRIYAVSSLITNGIRVRFPTRYYVRNDFFSNGQLDHDYDAVLFGLNNISEERPWVPAWDELVEILPPEPAQSEEKQK